MRTRASARWRASTTTTTPARCCRPACRGALQPLTPASARAAFFGMPLMTLGVIARIHWQALRLWLKRVPFFGKPAPPQAFITR